MDTRLVAKAIVALYPEAAFNVNEDGSIEWQREAPADYDQQRVDALYAELELGAIKKRLEAVVQEHLDATAVALGYTSIVSACSYAGAENPYQEEAKALLAWRAAVWAACYDIEREVRNGRLAVPSKDQLIAMLPPAP